MGIKDSASKFLRLLQVGLYDKDVSAERNFYNDGPYGKIKYTGASKVTREQSIVKGKQGKLYKGDLKTIGNALIEGIPDPYTVVADIFVNNNQVLGKVSVTYSSIEEADFVRECLGYFKQEDITVDDLFRGYDQFVNDWIESQRKQNPDLGFEALKKSANEKFFGSINKFFDEIHKTISPRQAQDTFKVLYANNFLTIQNLLKNSKLDIKEDLKQIKGYLTNSTFKLPEYRTTLKSEFNNQNAKRAARKKFIKELLEVARIVGANKDKQEKAGKNRVIDSSEINTNALAKNVLSPIHDLMSDQELDNFRQHQQKMFEELIPTLESPPKKSWKHTGVDIIYVMTLAAFAIGVMCTVANIKPFRDILQNMTKRELLSPAGKFFKSTVDFVTKLVGFEKAIIATTALAVGSVGATALRGLEREKLRDKKDVFWENFVREYYKAQTKVLSDSKAI